MVYNWENMWKCSNDEHTTGRVKYRGMVVSDLDGTLLRSDGTMNEKDMAALEKLGQDGFVRVIATGRSLFSLGKVLPQRFPADYIVFSTGAGISAYPSNRLLTSVRLQPAEVRTAVHILQDLQLDFSIQEPVPHNHRFQYWISGRANPDFARRLELYQNFCKPLPSALEGLGPAAQLIAILPADEDAITFSIVRERLPQLTVVRATSPLDHQSIWTEIFPSKAGKGKAVAWLAARMGIDSENILAIGNDFNDVDLLDLAGTKFMVDNAPPELKILYPTVAANNRAGVAEAINKWLESPQDY
ncbi:MAG: HAD family phosphatase [Deltaproteobacteria bacterium]|nr:HAD family phosphatase [Deltaproteobacteria bacterium]